MSCRTDRTWVVSCRASAGMVLCVLPLSCSVLVMRVSGAEDDENQSEGI